jgi:hypothetical protein
MPDFCARDNATASQTTALISSSLHGNFAMAGARLSFTRNSQPIAGPARSEVQPRADAGPNPHLLKD